MLSFWRSKPSTDLLTSDLHDEMTFYQAFIRDLENCKEEVIIESPFITNNRAQQLGPIFQELIAHGVKVYIITRNPREHEEFLGGQSEVAITYFEMIGVQILLCLGNHHRKLAILDRRVLWEGSLNILSQTRSREIMRRIVSKELTMQMFSFLKLGRFL